MSTRLAEMYSEANSDTMSVFYKLTARYAAIMDYELGCNQYYKDTRFTNLLISHSNAFHIIGESKYYKFKDYDCLLTGLDIKDDEADEMLLPGYYEMILGLYFGELSPAHKIENLVEPCDEEDFGHALYLFANAVYAHIYANHHPYDLPEYYMMYTYNLAIWNSRGKFAATDGITIANIFWQLIHDQSIMMDEIDNFYQFLENLAVMSENKKETCLFTPNGIFYNMSSVCSAIFSLNDEEIYSSMYRIAQLQVVPMFAVFSFISWPVVRCIMEYLFETPPSGKSYHPISFYEHRVMFLVSLHHFSKELTKRDAITRQISIYPIPEINLVCYFSELIKKRRPSAEQLEESLTVKARFFTLIDIICGPLPQLLCHATSNFMSFCFISTSTDIIERGLDHMYIDNIETIGVGDLLTYMNNINEKYLLTATERDIELAGVLKESFLQKILPNIKIVRYYEYNSPEDRGLVNNCLQGPTYETIEEVCTVCYQETSQLYRFCLGDQRERVNCACYMCKTCIQAVNQYNKNKETLCAICRRPSVQRPVTMQELIDVEQHFYELNQTSVAKMFN